MSFRRDTWPEIPRFDPGALDWAERAACRGMKADIFFPGKCHPSAYNEARQICRGCEVREECFTFAIDYNERIGMWGRTYTRGTKRMAQT